MNTPQDKRVKVLVVLLITGLFALLVLILGIYLSRQKEVSPGDVPAATQPIVTDWNYGTKDGDIWKQQPSQVLRFTPPTNFQGTVTIESQWGHSSGNAPCDQVQVNEVHTVSIPGINKTIVSNDQGDAVDQKDCTKIIQDLKDLGHNPGPFNKPHAVVGDDSTFFPSVPNDKVSGQWSSDKGDLVVNVNFSGLNGPPDEWCNQETGSKKDDRVCNGSHLFRVRVTWDTAEPTPTPSETPTPSPTIIPSPTPTIIPEKAGLGDFVWSDKNRNGIQDGGEQGLSGIKVELFAENGSNPLSTTTTGSDGKYSFVNLDAGNYFVKFTLNPGQEFTGANLGNDDEKDSDANTETGRTQTVALVAGQVNNSLDAGIVSSLGAIGDCVWIDVNRNGIQDESETSGLTGAFVALFSSDTANQMVDSMTTDGNGCYLFEDVEPGNYRVAFSIPEEYLFTTPSAGNDSCKDSDAVAGDNKLYGVTGNIDLQAGEQDLCWDAGVYYAVPNIKILKSEKADHETALDFQIVNINEKATFYITVYNNGFDDLQNVVVEDFGAPGCSRNVSEMDLSSTGGILKVGAEVSYSCESEMVNTPFTNTAEVNAVPVNASGEVMDWDDSEVSVSTHPAIMIRKSEKENHSTAEDLQRVPSGKKAKFYITVTNIGDVDLVTVKVTDELAPACTKDLSATLLDTAVPTGHLRAGESVTYTCESEALAAGFNNVAKVTGNTLEEEVTDEDDSRVEIYVPKQTPGIPSLPATGILDDGKWKVILPALGVMILGIGFVILGGPRKVGGLLSKDDKASGVLE